MGDTIGRASAFVCLPKRPPTLLFPIPLTCTTVARQLPRRKGGGGGREEEGWPPSAATDLRAL